MENPRVGIFVGFFINPEIAHDLSKSSQWKEANITRLERENEIQEIIFQDKKYIGRYIQRTNISTKDIESEEKAIRERLVCFIQSSKIEPLNLQIIAQYFLC
jgi:hypothetical protein